MDHDSFVCAMKGQHKGWGIDDSGDVNPGCVFITLIVSLGVLGVIMGGVL
jgi:hypothetical protein